MLMGGHRLLVRRLERLRSQSKESAFAEVPRLNSQVKFAKLQLLGPQHAAIATANEAIVLELPVVREFHVPGQHVLAVKERAEGGFLRRQLLDLDVTEIRFAVTGPQANLTFARGSVSAATP